MSYNDIISPRPEVLKKDGLEGVIDIENLRDPKGKKLESKPGDFFELTYPSSDIRLTIEHLERRFNSQEKNAGLFLLESYKGSGKSHLELLVYHLLKNPDIGRKWLSKHNLSFNIPENAIIAIHKFTDFPMDSIWLIVFKALGCEKQVTHERIPNIDEFRNALGGRQLVLIFDELEMGIKQMNPNSQARNLLYLQQLSEEANRTENASVTIFASVYDSRLEPGATLKRVPRIDIKLTNSEDRLKVIQHRLFSDYDKIDNKKAESVIQSYLNIWKRFENKPNENYIERMYQCYPFSPQLIDMVLFNVQSRGGFQGTRGGLGLLGTLLRNAYKKEDLITSANLDIDDKAIVNRLSDLDPAQKIIGCALNDYQDLHHLKFSREIIGSSLMATLAPSGHIQGINEKSLELEILKPGSDINEFTADLLKLMKYGTYFHSQEGNYFIDVQEKPGSKVEYRSLSIDPDKARDYALNIWKKDLFGDSNAVIFKDDSQAKAELNSLNKNSLRFVLSPKRLKENDRQALYNQMENRNQILLLEPHEGTFNGLDNKDIMKWSQRAIAAQEMEETAADERKRQYERIRKDDRSNIIEAFKRAGLIYIWMQQSKGNEELTAEIESLGGAVTAENVKKYIREDIFPRQRIQEHLLSRLNQINGLSIKDIDAEYKKTIGFPVITTMVTLLDAIKNLCIEGGIGLRHEKDSPCGRRPSLTDTEIFDAKISEPFEDSKTKNEIFNFGETTNKNETIEKPAPNENAPGANENVISIQTSFISSIGALRQEVAEKLNEYNDSTIKEIKFFIYSSQENIELSSVPSPLRGTLTGNGDITVDLVINKNGSYTKAQTEQMVEMLPVFNDVQYRAEMKLKVNAKVNEPA